MREDRIGTTRGPARQPPWQRRTNIWREITSPALGPERPRNGEALPQVARHDRQFRRQLKGRDMISSAEMDRRIEDLAKNVEAAAASPARALTPIHYRQTMQAFLDCLEAKDRYEESRAPGDNKNLTGRLPI